MSFCSRKKCLYHQKSIAQHHCLLEMRPRGQVSIFLSQSLTDVTRLTDASMCASFLKYLYYLLKKMSQMGRCFKMLTIEQGSSWNHYHQWLVPIVEGQKVESGGQSRDAALVLNCNGGAKMLSATGVTVSESSAESV